MRTLRTATFVSLDGVMQAPGGPKEDPRGGFKFGDLFTATAWISKPITPKVTLSTRLSWTDEGAIKGHYNGPHKHSSPPDRQENYGGQRLDAGIGFNAILPGRLRLGVEALLPLHQSLNGIQPPRSFGTTVNLSRAF